MAIYWRAGIVGRFTTGTWVGEMAYMGISGVAVDGGGDFQPVINQQLPTFTANPDGTFTDDPVYDIYGGSIGPGAWTLAHQKAIADALVAFASATKAYHHSSFKWQEVRVSAHNADDTVVNGATVFVLKSSLACTGATAVSGPDRAVAVSWRTSGRGARNRGRTYLPANVATAVTSDGLIMGTAKTAIGNAAKVLHDSVNVIENLEHVVVSKTHHTYSTITTVEVGDEFDTQSRRRRKRPESYQIF